MKWKQIRFNNICCYRHIYWARCGRAPIGIEKWHRLIHTILYAYVKLRSMIVSTTSSRDFCSFFFKFVFYDRLTLITSSNLIIICSHTHSDIAHITYIRDFSIGQLISGSFFFGKPGDAITSHVYLLFIHFVAAVSCSFAKNPTKFASKNWNLALGSTNYVILLKPHKNSSSRNRAALCDEWKNVCVSLYPGNAANCLKTFSI